MSEQKKNPYDHTSPSGRGETAMRNVEGGIDGELEDTGEQVRH